MQVWVVIPTYNEAENILPLLSSLLSLLPNAFVLVVDDHSPDGTGDLVERMGDERVHLIRREKRLGYASALLTGLKYAVSKGASFVVQMDADFSHDPKSLPRLLSTAREGADIVIGSRYLSGGRLDGLSFPRKILSKVANFLVGKIFKLPVKDSTSGFRVYRREAIEKLPLEGWKVEGFCLNFLLTTLAFWRGLNIVEVPIPFPQRRKGKSKLTMKRLLEATFALLKLYLWKKTGKWLGSPLFEQVKEERQPTH